MFGGHKGRTPKAKLSIMKEGIRGKTIVFTGKMSKPRNEFQALVEKHGGTAGSDVSKATDYLVVGEKPGSKLIRATLIGIKVISESEFLNLLKEEKGGEEPLSKEELLKIQENLVELECTNCGHLYKQWKSLPNWETCPVCEILTGPPQCPNCTDEGLWIEDLGLYHCMFCGQWWKAPYSIHSRRVKHLCYLGVASEIGNKATKVCIACGKQIVLTKSDIEDSTNRYKNAPIQFLELKRRSQDLQEREKKEEMEKEKERTLKAWIESLTPEEIKQIEEKLNVL